MGYSVTTSPLIRASRPSKSQARNFRGSQKTHTPVSRMEVTGARFYSPDTAKWLSRDPIEEFGWRALNVDDYSRPLQLQGLFRFAFMTAYPNVYLFLQNAPIDKVDPHGLDEYDCKPCNSGDTIGRKQKDNWDPYDNDATDDTCTGVPDGIFLPACLKHDACYATCNKPKSECDDAFYYDLYDLCSASCGASFACNLACAWSAQWYYGGVVSFGDSPAAAIFGQSYSQLQNAACEDCCCE